MCSGRETIRALAFPRDSPPSAAEVTLELDIDAEHGTILRRAVRRGGEVIATMEAMKVVYDQPIDPRVFDLDPLRGWWTISTPGESRRDSGGRMGN
jgi:hypothetical protein